METPERLENCPPTPEEPSLVEGSAENLDEARVSKLKLLESTICVICYSSVKAKSFPSCCLHIFCFQCLVKWSKQKNQCPLCKKAFDIIIHNVKTKTEYDKYQVVVNRPQPSDSPIINLTDLSIPIIPIELNSVFHRVNFLTNHGQPRRRFTYRTRFEATLEQNERIQELFGASENYTGLTRLTPAEWRRFVYDRNLFALPLPDLTGRYRECSAEYYRENPAQTHRLIPFINRDLVVLMPQNNINSIPQILEDIRENLCLHDIQSREIRDYFRRYLQEKADHFVHEFYNFAISPYDIVGYDRHVDYTSREQSDAATVEISSNESSDSEVQLIDDGLAGSLNSVLRTTSEDASHIIENSSRESDLRNDDVGEVSNNAPAASCEVVVESDSDNSEVLFVLALKPPEQRTPEQISLDSASDSDVQYIPNSPPKRLEPNTIYTSETDDPDDNKTLSETRKQLKAEVDVKFNITSTDIRSGEVIPEQQSLLNFGASTSTASQPDENMLTQKKFYYHPIRKRPSGKTIFDSSSSSSSSDSKTSDEEWHLQLSSRLEKKHNKSSKNRRKSAKSHKKRKTSSTIVSNQKQLPLSMLPSSEEAKEDEDKMMSPLEYPRVKSVIIKKYAEKHYIHNSGD